MELIGFHESETRAQVADPNPFVVMGLRTDHRLRGLTGRAWARFQGLGQARILIGLEPKTGY